MLASSALQAAAVGSFVMTAGHDFTGNAWVYRECMGLFGSVELRDGSQPIHPNALLQKLFEVDSFHGTSRWNGYRLTCVNSQNPGSVVTTALNDKPP